MKRDFKKYLHHALLVILGFLSAQVSFVTGIYPFGIALLCTLNLSKEFFCIFVGCILGSAVSAQSLPQILFYLLPYALILPELLILNKFFKQKLFFFCFSAFLSFLIPALTVPVAVSEKLTFVFTGIISAFLFPLLKRLYTVFEEIEDRLSLENADVLSLCLVGGLAVSSLPRLQIFSFDLCVFSLLATSALAVTAYSVSGSIWSAVCGIIWIIKGGDTCIALCLISGGLISGLLESKRGGILLGFILGDLTVTLFLLNSPSLSLGAVNILLGCGYTVFLSRNFRERLRRLAGKNSGITDTEMTYLNELRTKQQDKLRSAGKMYGEIANTFISASHERYMKDALISSAREVCKNCVKREYCENIRGSDTLSEFTFLSETVIDRHKITSLPDSLNARCLQPINIISAINSAYGNFSRAIDESGENETALQLKSISELLFSLAENMDELPEFDREKERQVRDVLSSKIYGITGVFCKRKGDGHLLEISAKKNFRGIKEDIASALTNGFSHPYRCLSGGTDKKGGFTGIFAPAPKFSVDAFALRENKQGETVCGDSFTVKNVGNERYLAAISDGAGSGKRAKAKSESALDLLEAFSETGIGRKETFKAMNRLLLSKNTPEEYSTVDVAELDLENGILYWTKIGAVPGYLLRCGKVEKIGSGALPIGIVSRINPSTVKKLLQNGDVLVLVSDGVYDGLCNGKSDKITSMLPSLANFSPEKTANAIMAKAKESGRDDDKTIMVLKVKSA